MATSYAPVVDALAGQKQGKPNIDPAMLASIKAGQQPNGYMWGKGNQIWDPNQSAENQTPNYENVIYQMDPETTGGTSKWGTWNPDGTYRGEGTGPGQNWDTAVMMATGLGIGGVAAGVDAAAGATAMGPEATQLGYMGQSATMPAANTVANAGGSTSGAWNGVDFSGPAATGGTTAATTAAGGAAPAATTTAAGTTAATTATQLMNGVKTVAPLVGAAATLGAGGSPASPGPTPDYVKQAIATSNSGKYDEVTPYGTITWSLKPGADPSNPQPGDYIRTTNMSPEQQQLYQQQTGNQLKAGQVGGQQLADLGQGRQATEDALYKRYTNRYDQNFGEGEEQLRTRLTLAGLNEGTEAFDRELRNFRQNKDDAYADATERSIAGASQQENDAVARIANIMALSKGTTPTSANSAGGAPTDLLTAANQSYNANLGAANAQNAADAQQQNAWLQLLLGGMKYYGG